VSRLDELIGRGSTVEVVPVIRRPNVPRRVDGHVGQHLDATAFRNVDRIVALCAALAGCQTDARAPSTASGKPEVTIKATTGAVKARLLSLAMNRQFNVTKDTEYL
jgi:hypothetical protein